MRSYYKRGRRDTLPRTVARARRANRRARARLVRKEAQLRAAVADAERNLGVAINVREGNVQMAHRAQGIMDQTRAERTRILAASVQRTKRTEWAMLAALCGSLALLVREAWRAMQ